MGVNNEPPKGDVAIKAHEEGALENRKKEAQKAGDYLGRKSISKTADH